MKSEDIFVIELQSKNVKWWHNNYCVENKILLNCDINQMMRRSRFSFLKNCCRVDSWMLMIFNLIKNLSISKSKNNKKNVNCLIADDLQKSNNQNIFHFNANAMLQETKELTIIIYISTASFNVQIVNRKKNLQSRASWTINEIFIIKN